MPGRVLRDCRRDMLAIRQRAATPPHMDWTELWDAGPRVAVHAIMGLVAVGLGGLQLALPKGTARHRVMGYAWAGLMVAIAVGSFWLNYLRMVGPFSIIHLLSAFMLWAVWSSVMEARRGDIRAHRRSMRQLYGLGVVLTGLFTLWPGRTMYQVLFGN